MAEKVKLLAFDTSSNTCSVAILNNSSIHTISKIESKQQGKLILPLIEALLKEVSLTLEELDGIAYGCGPGSYTGIRIACSVAQGIALANQCPIIPISSLAAMAQTAYGVHHWEQVLVALDAHMGEIYWAKYHVGKSGLVELQGKEAVSKPEQVHIEDPENWYGIGSAWDKYGEIVLNSSPKQLKSINNSIFPSAEAILELAKVQYLQKNWVSPSNAIPVYLR